MLRHMHMLLVTFGTMAIPSIVHHRARDSFRSRIGRLFGKIQAARYLLSRVRQNCLSVEILKNDPPSRRNGL